MIRAAGFANGKPVVYIGLEQADVEKLVNDLVTRGQDGTSWVINLRHMHGVDGPDIPFLPDVDVVLLAAGENELAAINRAHLRGLE